MRLFFALILVATTAFAQPVPANEVLDVAVKGYSLANTEYRSGQGSLDSAADWSKRVFDLQKAAKAPKAGEDYVYRMRDLEKTAFARVRSGSASKLEGLNATYLRLEAEAAVKK